MKTKEAVCTEAASGISTHIWTRTSTDTETKRQADRQTTHTRTNMQVHTPHPRQCPQSREHRHALRPEKECVVMRQARQCLLRSDWKRRTHTCTHQTHTHTESPSKPHHRPRIVCTHLACELALLHTNECHCCICREHSAQNLQVRRHATQTHAQWKWGVCAASAVPPSRAPS